MIIQKNQPIANQFFPKREFKKSEFKIGKKEEKLSFGEIIKMELEKYSN